MDMNHYAKRMFRMCVVLLLVGFTISVYGQESPEATTVDPPGNSENAGSNNGGGNGGGGAGGEGVDPTAGTGGGSTGDGATSDGATGDGTTGDGATGDGATGDGATDDGATTVGTGDGATGDGATGDGATGDGETGDGATGDGATDDETGDSADDAETTVAAAANTTTTTTTTPEASPTNKTATPGPTEDDGESKWWNYDPSRGEGWQAPHVWVILGSTLGTFVFVISTCIICYWLKHRGVKIQIFQDRPNTSASKRDIATPSNVSIYPHRPTYIESNF